MTSEASRTGQWPGPYLRVEPLQLDAIPPHPVIDQALGLPSDHSPSLKTFVKDLLGEARALAKDEVPQWGPLKVVTRKLCKMDPTTEVRQRIVKRSEIITGLKGSVRNPDTYPNDAAEYWFARQSDHPNSDSTGTASFAEFKKGILRDHSENEKAYTPDLYDARVVLDYQEQLKQAGLTTSASQPGVNEQFEDLTLRIMEMVHKMPMFTTNRVFAVLVLTASLNKYEFLVVQVPVDARRLPGSLYSTGKQLSHDWSPSEPDLDQKRKKVEVGHYTSVEHCMQTQDGTSTRWTMATTSDARGSLPGRRVQAEGIPMTILKDIDFFLKWTEQQRTITKTPINPT